jgi:hypothetical protein
MVVVVMVVVMGSGRRARQRVNFNRSLRTGRRSLWQRFVESGGGL